MWFQYNKKALPFAYVWLLLLVLMYFVQREMIDLLIFVPVYCFLFRKKGLKRIFRFFQPSFVPKAILLTCGAIIAQFVLAFTLSSLFGNHIFTQHSLSVNMDNSQNKIAYLLLIIPMFFQVILEELFSITVFSTFYYRLSNYKNGIILSGILTAMLFAFAHGNTYQWSFFTLLIMFFTDIFFITSWFKAKSIWASISVHFTFDVIIMLLAFL